MGLRSPKNCNEASFLLLNLPTIFMNYFNHIRKDQTPCFKNQFFIKFLAWLAIRIVSTTA